jgi:crotonobetainyl-CoA:carnitine CoA-transferase CaiB-like acyl-CoA transferase
MRPLEGVRVVELGLYAAGPSCGAVLADWGADVIKLEPVEGERARSRGVVGTTEQQARPLNPRYEMHNRGKRSLAVDVSSTGGLGVALALVDRSDVFVTNMRIESLRRIGLDPQTLLDRCAELIYGQVSAYGLGHEHENRGSYDHGAFWSRSGAASLFQQPGSPPPQPSGGMGDRVAGSLLAGGIAAALFARARSRSARHVQVSLAGTAAWMLGSDLSDLLASGATKHVTDRRAAPVPTLNSFQDRDGRWFWLMLMEPDRLWPGFLRAMDSPLLAADKRYRDGDPALLAQHGRDLVALLDEIFATRALTEWESRLRPEGILLEPVLTLEEAVQDPVNQAAERFATGAAADGSARTVVRPPVRFGVAGAPGPVSAPAPGAHTTEVLREVGMSETEIEELLGAGAVAATQAQGGRS